MSTPGGRLVDEGIQRMLLPPCKIINCYAPNMMPKIKPGGVGATELRPIPPSVTPAPHF